MYLGFKNIFNKIKNQLIDRTKLYPIRKCGVKLIRIIGTPLTSVRWRAALPGTARHEPAFNPARFRCDELLATRSPHPSRSTQGLSVHAPGWQRGRADWSATAIRRPSRRGRTR